MAPYSGRERSMAYTSLLLGAVEMAEMKDPEWSYSKAPPAHLSHTFTCGGWSLLFASGNAGGRVIIYSVKTESGTLAQGNSPHNPSYRLTHLTHLTRWKGQRPGRGPMENESITSFVRPVVLIR